MAPGTFDIYRSAAGYVAVTNHVRRQILEALAEGEKELPELVGLTGKAKPTLSSVHMKELLAQRLIEAEPHPQDSRRKVYRLVADKIGSSNVPVDTLRDAVSDDLPSSHLTVRFPLAVSLQALASAPLGTDLAVLRAQAETLGRATGPPLEARDASTFLMALAPFLEQEGLARPLRLDLERGLIELAFGRALPVDAPADALAALLTGFVAGAAAGKGFETQVWLEGFDEGRRCSLRCAPLPQRQAD